MNSAVSHSPHPFTSPHPAHRTRNTNIFQPPQSPALTSSTDYFSHSRSRKRSRPDSVDERHTPWGAGLHTPSAATNTPGQSWIQCPTPNDGIYGSASCAAGSGGLVNERYLLRDGFDTPGLMASGGMENERGRGGGGDGDWRRGNMRDDGFGGGGGREEGRLLSGPLARERNGAARTRSSPAVPQQQKQQGWAGFAFGLLGKAFNFGTGMFKGFYAGGGQGYDVSGTPTGSSRPNRPRLSRGSTPVPGAWQEDDFMGDFEQDRNDFSSPAPSGSRPGNKRRQTDKDSWVMVSTPDLSDASPKRKISSSSVPRSNTLSANRPSASRASSRRNLAPVSRRQSSYVTHTGSPALDSRQRPPLDPPRRASFAPTRSRPSNSHTQSRAQENENQAYVSPEAERFVRRQAKQDRKADAAMSSMSKQLQDLIRQGQEALGTKYDIEDEGGGGDEDMDEGYVDDDAGWR